MYTAEQYAGIVSASTSESMCLGACGLGDEDMFLICEAIKTNVYIKEVAFFQNGLTSNSAKEIAALILANTRIQRIDLSNNHIDELGQETIRAAIITSERQVHVNFETQSVPVPAPTNKENQKNATYN